MKKTYLLLLLVSVVFPMTVLASQGMPAAARALPIPITTGLPGVPGSVIVLVNLPYLQTQSENLKSLQNIPTLVDEFLRPILSELQGK